MKIVRYKVFFLYRKYSLENKDTYTADTVIALLAMVAFLYCTPVLAMLLKLTGLLEFKVLCWMVFGIFAFLNFNFINRKYRSEIHHAIEYVSVNDMRRRDKYLILFLSAFSFPYLVITVSLLRSANFL
ncbi:MAG: hypothetical protein JWN78_365 [Bacteroidota bacterium]|nr:hypothetical protein [Bacteroidota bacterium]